MKTLKVGISNADMEVKMSKLLLGYNLQSVNGMYSEPYRDFVKAWQSSHNLDADGIIGNNTWNAIAEQATVCSKTKGTKSAIMALQMYIGVTADGIFGSKTKAAVVAFQASKGLVTDGVVGKNTWKAMLVDEPQTIVSGVFLQPKDFKQYDSKWGSIVYTSCGNKSQTIKNSGCGPTAMANIVYTLKDKNVTPAVLAKLSVDNGYRTKSSGTSWGFFKFIASKYGFSKMIETTSLATLKSCLDAGGYAVCSMAPGYWTKGGHFITAWKYDSTYIYCNDPASSTRKKQKLTDFVKERKAFFCFYK